MSEEENWQVKLADELHKPIKRNFTRRRVIANHIDEIWCSDLVEMQQFSKWNKGYRYLLMVLDVFSKYGWIVPLKDKKGETVAEAFKKIFKEGRKPQYLWTDKGKEYYNKHSSRGDGVTSAPLLEPILRSHFALAFLLVFEFVF